MAGLHPEGRSTVEDAKSRAFLAREEGRAAAGEESSAKPLRAGWISCQTSQSNEAVVAADDIEGERMTTVLEQVRRLIERLAPICDDCITERLGLSVRQHANHKTRELAGVEGFERRIGPYAICGSAKKVIFRKPR
jgi:hypothetical protein